MVHVRLVSVVIAVMECAALKSSVNPAGLTRKCWLLFLHDGLNLTVTSSVSSVTSSSGRRLLSVGADGFEW